RAARTRPASGSRRPSGWNRPSRRSSPSIFHPMEEFRLVLAAEPPESPARTRPPSREPFRIAAVQQRWHADREEHEESLRAGIEIAAAEGARLVCLQELTLSPYFATTPDGPQAAGAAPEELPGGPTHEFATRMAAELGVHV